MMDYYIQGEMNALQLPAKDLYKYQAHNIEPKNKVEVKYIQCGSIYIKFKTRNN